MNLFLLEEMKVNPRASGNIAARERRGSLLHSKKSFALLDFAPDATLVVDQQGIIAWSNARAGELLGRSSHQLVEVPILSIIPDLPVALFPFDVHSFFQDPTHHRAGHRNTLKARRSDDTEVTLDVTFSRLDVNSLVYTWATLREAINPPETEAQTSETQTYDRSLIEASLDPQISNGPDGIITDVNEAMVQVTGVQRESLMGTPFPQYFTEPRKAEEAYQQAFYKGIVRNYPLSIRHVSGKITDVLYNATVYKDQNGVVQGVFASIRDITDRKQAEEELKRQQAYTRSLIEASLDPLVTISPDGKITDVNEASVRATGVSRWNLIGTDFSDYFTEPEKAREGYEQVFAQGFVADYPLTIRHNLRKVLYNASVYKDDRGRVLGVFAAARDITAQSKQEVRINKLNEELEQRVMELESFSYSVSHDLRAPLRGIDGFIAIFLNKYLDKVDEEGQRLLNNVRRNVNKMGSLIDELLTLSRIGMKDIQVTQIDMFELVNIVLEELSEQKGKCTVVIKRLVPAMGDVALIKQVLVNLISNAFKYSAKKDKPVIEIGCYPDEGDTQYYIRDNGIGFDMEYSNKLFGVFQRLHDPEEYQGTGVGLAIVKRIIIRHGGSVWAVGKEGEGATFYFTLKSSTENGKQ
jgi:PAS domain S-box-containing protein